MGFRRKSRHLQEDNASFCNYVKKAFNGIVVDTSIKEDTAITCEKSVDTCCNHISYDATCDNTYDSNSLCQMECCCNFPDADCCKAISLNKKCDFDSFCTGNSTASTFPPTTLNKVSVYFPALDVAVASPIVD